MIEDLWLELKAKLLAEGGRDKLVEFLQHALVIAQLEREKQAERMNARNRLQ